MDAMLLYFLKVNIAFAALYLFYRLLLHRDTFFREKRFAFLMGFLFALLHPLIDISSWIESSKPVVYMVQSISTSLPEIIITDGTRNTILSTQEMIFLAYGMVAALFILRILWQTGTVLALASHGRKEKIDGFTVINLPKGTAPFSFFGMIFLNPDDYSTKDLEEILHHEGAHVNQFHTLDVIFAELVCALFWINPATWLMKRHMRENLEYLADNDVLHSGYDPKSYQYHLLRLSYQQSTSIMANHFNVTQLKNRIIMMNKKKTSLAGLGKYALSLPLFAFLLLAAYAWGAKTELPTLSAIAAVAMPSVEQAPPPPQVKAANTVKNNVKTPVTSKKLADKEKNLTTIDVTDIRTESEGNEKVYTTVDKMPVYPGGNEELMKYILSNLRYPLSAKDKGIQGRVIIRFVINTKGEVSDAVVLRGLDSDCDNEALRVIKGMPNWIPGSQNGRVVPVYFTIPIVYRLSKDEEKRLDELASIKPLIIVDDKEFIGDLGSINPADMESVTVLKDSAAVELYGEKGIKGVIKITLKKKSQ